MRNGVAGVLVLLALTVDARPALASRATQLLLPFDIADAPSLPWDEGACCGRPEYDVARLVGDTEALLTPRTPIIVRIETLRRAAIYASSDRRVAVRLLTRFGERLRPEARGDTSAVVAVLDFAFLIEAIRQIGDQSSKPFTRRSTEVRGLLGGLDGTALLETVVAGRSNDPQLDFAAALIAGRHITGPEFVDCAKNGVARAGHDPLVARNVHRVRTKRPAATNLVKVSIRTSPVLLDIVVKWDPPSLSVRHPVQTKLSAGQDSHLQISQENRPGVETQHGVVLAGKGTGGQMTGEVFTDVRGPTRPCDPPYRSFRTGWR